jgi:hypothetical protein
MQSRSSCISTCALFLTRSLSDSARVSHTHSRSRSSLTHSRTHLLAHSRIHTHSITHACTTKQTPAEQALISKFSVAILAWQLETDASPAWRHGEDKLHAQAAALAISAPHTQVMLYLQGQLAIDWYETTRAMLPPPCGTDSVNAFADFWLVNATDGKPAHWPSPHCGPDLNYDFSQQKVRDHYVESVVLPLASAPNVHGIWFDDTDWLACQDMCNEVHGIHLKPCDMAAKISLFNGA